MRGHSADEDSEEDKALEQRILDEAAIEREMHEVLQNEYQDKKEPEQKQLTQKEFDMIIDDHLKSMGQKKGILKNAKAPPQAPKVETVSTKGTGQATLYFGGAKPNSKASKSKKAVHAGVQKALEPTHDFPEEFKAKMREMAATRAERVRGVNVEPSDDEEEEEEESVEEEEGEEAPDVMPRGMHVKKTPEELMRPKREPKVETVNAKGGGQIVFYFGGAKPNSKAAKPKKEAPQGSDKAQEPAQDYPEEFKAKMREMAASKEERLRGVQLEESEGEEEGEEEEQESEEEEEDYDINPEVDDEIDIKMKRMKLNQKLPLCERIERDNNLLPDEINGLKVFKKTLLPEIPYSQDFAAQECNAEEEEIDFSQPPTVFDSKSIREPLVEYEYKPKVLSKEQALDGATVVKEYKSSKKKPSKKSRAKEAPKPEAEPPAEPKEESSSEGSEGGDAASQLPARRKDETPEERRARKELVKRAKEERKLKKRKFKEKYEQMKKGVIGQINAHTGTTQGVSMYRIG